VAESAAAAGSSAAAEAAARLQQHKAAAADAAADASSAAADASSAAAAALAAPSPSPQPPSAAASPEPAAGGAKGPSSNFIKRVIFGVLLGLGAAAIIIYGRLPFLATTMFVVYQATQEYFGIVTSKGISRGMDAPPPLVSAMTTVLCLSITLTTYVTGIKSGTAMCVAAFLLLVMNVIGNRRPTFSQLTSSVFGLFYCGEFIGGGALVGVHVWHCVVVLEGGRRGRGQWMCARILLSHHQRHSSLARHHHHLPLV